MKVLYLRSSFDPGGTEKLLLDLYNYKQYKIQFYYIFIKSGTLIEKLKSKFNRYYVIEAKYKIDFRVILQIIKIIKVEKIKIIHTHQAYELFYAILLKLLINELKVFHTIHGYNKEKKWLDILEKILIYFTEKSFVVSYSARLKFFKKGYNKSKLNVLYNAVFLNEDSKLIEQYSNDILLKFNYSTEDYLIGMIGNFVWWKDQLTIVKAFIQLKTKIKNLKLIFIGKESVYSNECKKLLSTEDLKQVFFLGSISNAFNYLKYFDQFIMSTLDDTFGIAVIEAILKEVPVIASDIDVMKELSFNGKYFDLFRTGDEKDLANKILYHYNYRDSKKAIKAKKYVKKKFSIDKYIQTLEKIYEN